MYENNLSHRSIYYVYISPSCSKKNTVYKAVSDSSLVIRFKDCSKKVFGANTVTICFDSLLTDSRCPKNVECIWAGTAIAKFLFTDKNITYPITLATLKFGSFSPDTVVAGYKIKFINLTPYPDTSLPPAPLNQENAEVQITR